MAKLTNQGYLKAIEILKRNSTNFGFKASSNVYNSIWARDGIITLLGAILSGESQLIKTSRLTLEVLKKYQTPLGQIPNVFLLDKKISKFYAFDSTPWWIIGMEKYFFYTQDRDFLSKNWLAIKKAFLWLKYQIKDKSGLIDTPRASDWMDSSVGREGKVFYNNCLYYQAIKSVNFLAHLMREEKFAEEKEFKRKINLLFWPHSQGKNLLDVFHWGFFEEGINPWREHYLNYFSFEHLDDRCDVLGNILAILFGLTDKEKQGKIINYFIKKHISHPYPVKVLNPPIFYPNPTWNPKIDLYREKQWQNLPFCYHNAGIWPYVGGFYVSALVKAGFKEKAEEELEKLVWANKIGKKYEWEFNEWLEGKTGQPKGEVRQSWSAAGYLIAYQAVTEGKIIF